MRKEESLFYGSNLHNIDYSQVAVTQVMVARDEIQWWSPVQFNLLC
jgi:hypothetical protein